MLPKLTAGSIKKILEGEEVSDAVLQILDCQKIPSTGNDRYQLVISDGVTGCSFAMLGTRLNNLVTNKTLEKFTIVRVDKYVCDQTQTDRKVINVLNMVVLVSGVDVGEEIGNPIISHSSTSTSSATTNATENVESKSVFNVASISTSTQSSCSSMHDVCPIASLAPLYRPEWTIRARITSKTSVRTCSTSSGEGKSFSVTFLDESGEIRATGFNDAVDKFYKFLELNKVYYVSRATLKAGNETYNTANNKYEMYFNANTGIRKSEESFSSIPMMQYNFVPIHNIENSKKGSLIDVIGVVKSAGEAKTFVARNTNKEHTKRDITIVDKSKAEISLTLWGNEAQEFDGSSNPVIAIKGAKVSEFNGLLSLSATISSTLVVNPDIDEAHSLKEWMNTRDCNLEWDGFIEEVALV